MVDKEILAGIREFHHRRDLLGEQDRCRCGQKMPCDGVMLLDYIEQQAQALAESERSLHNVLDLLSQEVRTRDAALAECDRLRISLRAIRTATMLPLPSEQTGPEWDSCARVSIQRLQDIDEVLDRALGEPALTGEPMPSLYPGPRTGGAEAGG